METEFSGALLLVSGGILLCSTLFSVHLVSTYNRFSMQKLPLLFATMVAICITLVIVSETQASIIQSIRLVLGGSIGALLSLFPVLAAISTIFLFRITLLTNRPVGASS
ncbi:MAG: hypothetical protein CMB67_02460 [Euryarchaeota archaeon]|nr:hypothetical protein [Euryarchaeota archaeon]